MGKLTEIVPFADRLVERFRVVEYLNASFYTGLGGGAWATYFIQKGEYLTAALGIIIPLLVHGLTRIRYDLEKRGTMFQIDDLEYEKTQLERRIQKLEPQNSEQEPN